jgi:hypothetical protein
LARLDRSKFTEVVPRWVSPFAFDSCAEWTGTAPWDPDVPLRVSAAAWRGRPVDFEVRGPWSRALAMEPRPVPATLAFAQASGTVFLIILGAVGVLLARRNMRLGRGDRRGAVRVGFVILGLGVLQWVLVAHHVSDFALEFGQYFEAFGLALVLAALTATVYLAVEPLVRRRTPELLIGWARALDGRFGDPRVGRDVLVGAIFGAILALVTHVTNGLPAWFPLGGQTPMPAAMEPLTGGRLLAGFVILGARAALFTGMAMLGGFFLFLLLLRKPGAAAVGLAAVLTLIFLGGENVALETPGAIAMAALFAFVIARFGMLATVAAAFYRGALVAAPLPFDPRTPYAANVAIMLLTIGAIAIYAFRISLGARPIFDFALDE